MSRLRINKTNIEAALTSALKLKDPQFILEKYKRINGSIISPTFEHKGDLRRQIMIWDALEKVFGPDVTQSIGTMLAYTPLEWDPTKAPLTRSEANGRRRTRNGRVHVKSGK